MLNGRHILFLVSTWLLSLAALPFSSHAQPQALGEGHTLPTTVTASGAEDAASITVTLSGTDVDGRIASYTVKTLPTNGLLFTNSALTAVVVVNAVYPGATLYFVPAANFNGTADFTYTVTDNDNSSLNSLKKEMEKPPPRKTVQPALDSPPLPPHPLSAASLSTPLNREGVIANFGAGDEAPALKAEDHPDLWARLRSGLALPGRDHPKVPGEIQQYAGGQGYLDRVTVRARPFLYYVLQEVEKRGLPSEIALLPVVESSYIPQAESPKGAAGIWQFMPATGRHYGLKKTFWYDGRRDIMASTQAALNYLERLNADFGGDWLLTLAAYNAGEGTVQRAINRNREAGMATDFWSLDLPRETETYVPRLLAIAAIVAEPELFGVKLDSIPNRRYLAAVKLPAQINLNKAAKLADMTRAELSHLNSGYVRDATDPQGPHQLLLPVDKVRGFNNKLSALRSGASERPRQTSKNPSSPRPPESTGQMVQYTVKPGDTLSGIAQRFRTSARELRSWNAAQLESKPLQAGATLTLYLKFTTIAQNSKLADSFPAVKSAL